MVGKVLIRTIQENISYWIWVTKLTVGLLIVNFKFQNCSTYSNRPVKAGKVRWNHLDEISALTESEKFKGVKYQIPKFCVNPGEKRRVGDRISKHSFIILPWQSKNIFYLFFEILIWILISLKPRFMNGSWIIFENKKKIKTKTGYLPVISWVRTTKRSRIFSSIRANLRVGGGREIHLSIGVLWFVIVDRIIPWLNNKTLYDKLWDKIKFHME